MSSATRTPIRVLVVEASAPAREDLVRLLEESPGFVVAGTAADGAQALERARRLAPDVVLLDARLPRMNGFDTTRRIMEEAPTRIIILSNGTDLNEQVLTFEALQAGALTAVSRPFGTDDPRQRESAEKLIETLQLMSEIKVVRRWPKRQSERREITPIGRPIEIIAIGASTGGPVTLTAILDDLPADFAIPILIVQHIASGFATGLAEWLSRKTHRHVKTAEAGELVRAGQVYLAPDGLQMGVTHRGRIQLADERSEDDFRPSVSYLFQSVARAFGPLGAGVLLTGMGQDGAKGLRALRDAGGLTIAQEESSCVVFGMPQEAVRLHAAQHVLAPTEIAAVLRSLKAPGREPI